MNQNIYIQNGVLAIISRIKEKFKQLKSMRVQLFCVFIFVGIVPLILLARFMLFAYEDQSISKRTALLTHYTNVISNLALTGNFLANSDKEAAEVANINDEIDWVAETYDGRIMLVDDSLYVIKDTYDVDEGKILISPEVVKSVKGSGGNTYLDKVHRYIEMTSPIVDPTTKEIVGAIIVNFSVKDITEVYVEISQKAMLVILALAMVIIVFAVFYSGMVTKPFKKISSSIDRLTEGYMDEKVSIKGFAEIERVSDSFNEMIGRMQKLENSRQEFVSNVSHELKTPITSIKVLAESLLTQEDVSVGIYKEFMVDITDEIERENKIINDLLSLVKLDKTAGEMNISSININDLLEQILKRLRPIAQKRNIELVFESFRPVVADVDEVKLSLAVNNLIENAIKYNYDDGWVHVSLNADHKFFYVKVSDSGVGIPEDEQTSIFERFYRIDKARSRETGGTGLGLSITRNAVLMHRGAIKVYSKEKEGTTFTVRIPLTYIA